MHYLDLLAAYRVARKKERDYMATTRSNMFDGGRNRYRHAVLLQLQIECDNLARQIADIEVDRKLP